MTYIVGCRGITQLGGLVPINHMQDKKIEKDRKILGLVKFIFFPKNENFFLFLPRPIRQLDFKELDALHKILKLI